MREFSVIIEKDEDGYFVASVRHFAVVILRQNLLIR